MSPHYYPLLQPVTVGSLGLPAPLDLCSTSTSPDPPSPPFPALSPFTSSPPFFQAWCTSLRTFLRSHHNPQISKVSCKNRSRCSAYSHRAYRRHSRSCGLSSERWLNLPPLHLPKCQEPRLHSCQTTPPLVPRGSEPLKRSSMLSKRARLGESSTHGMSVWLKSAVTRVPSVCFASISTRCC